MKFRMISLLVLLWISTMVWAPTCSSGPLGDIYYIDNISRLGLPVVDSSGPVIDILNATDNSLLVEGVRYSCYSGGTCELRSSNEKQRSWLGLGTTRVILVVNNSSKYVADLRYNGTGGIINCGGSTFVVENIWPAEVVYLAVVLAAVALIVTIIVGSSIVNKNSRNKSKKRPKNS